jgi:hypothetical protein
VSQYLAGHFLKLRVSVSLSELGEGVMIASASAAKNRVVVVTT